MKLPQIAAAILALVATACGGGHDGHGDAGAKGKVASRTVDVDMVDLAFQPPALTAARGETVRFVFHNRGKLPHDAFIADAAAQADHEKEMREKEGADHGMGEAAITVDPGQTDELLYTFDRPGPVEIGCHQPGHYDAGMKLVVTVS